MVRPCCRPNCKWSSASITPDEPSIVSFACVWLKFHFQVSNSFDEFEGRVVADLGCGTVRGGGAQSLWLGMLWGTC